MTLPSPKPRERVESKYSLFISSSILEGQAGRIGRLSETDRDGGQEEIDEALQKVFQWAGISR